VRHSISYLFTLVSSLFLLPIIYVTHSHIFVFNISFEDEIYSLFLFFCTGCFTRDNQTFTKWNRFTHKDKGAELCFVNYHVHTCSCTRHSSCCHVELFFFVLILARSNVLHLTGYLWRDNQTITRWKWFTHTERGTTNLIQLWECSWQKLSELLDTLCLVILNWFLCFDIYAKHEGTYCILQATLEETVKQLQNESALHTQKEVISMHSMVGWNGLICCGLHKARFFYLFPNYLSLLSLFAMCFCKHP
jgi:hypothetical protein